MWDLVGNPEDQLSHNEAQIIKAVSGLNLPLELYNSDCSRGLLTASFSASSAEEVAWYDRTSRATVCLAISLQAFSYI